MITPERWMHDSAIIQPFIRQGVSGPEYGKAYEVKCILSLGRKATYRQSENPSIEIIANGKLYFPAGTRINPQDRLTVNGRSYMALICRPRTDWNGAENHVEVGIQ